MPNLKNKFCYITNKDSLYYNDWGIIKEFDGDDYHIAINNGLDSLPIFKRGEFTIPKKQPRAY